MASLMEKAKNYITEKVTDIPKPEASVEDVDLKGVASDGVTYEAQVVVQNPYSHSIPICEITFLFKSAGRVIASGNIADPGSLKGNDKTNLKVPVKVPHSVLVSLARDVGADWDIDYELQLGLVIDLSCHRKLHHPNLKQGRNQAALSLRHFLATVI